MVKGFLSALWRRLPKGVRRRLVVALNERFTVAAAVAVFDDDGRVLLLHHRFRAGSGWGLPGGFLSAREQPEAAVRRELREEVGLDLDDVELVLVRTLAFANQIEVLYRARPNGEPTIRARFEVDELAWFDLGSLPDGLSGDQRRLVERALDGVRSTSTDADEGA